MLRKLKKKITYNLDDGVRLDHFLNSELSEFSRSKIQKLIKAGKITVNGFIIKPSFILKNGSVIDILENKINSGLEVRPEKIDLDILYEDEDIIAVNKSSGIVVHPGINNYSGTLLNGLLYYCNHLSNVDENRPGIIHRLDKETSGLIIIAKNDFSHYFISEQFASRKIEKVYKALVWGQVIQEGKVEGYLNRNPKNRIAFQLSHSNGKFSYSTYSPISNNSFPISFLNVFPKTGRTHQIRVHLSSIKHPIINDELYYDGKYAANSYHDKYRVDINKVLKTIKRVALHSSSLSFLHPTKKKKITINAPMPNDFKNASEIINEIKE